MKQKLAFFLIIFGALIMAFTGIFNFLPPIVISILGGFGLSFGYLLFTSIYGGVIWGVKINATTMSLLKMLIGVLGLFLGGYAFASVIVSFALYLSQGEFVALIINFVVFIVCVAVGPIVGKIVLEKTLAQDNNALCLEQFSLFGAVEENIGQANHFVVSFEGVALFSNTNYCYAVFLYEDYQLGSLNTPQEVALVGSYFVQKYSNDFTFKVDVEVIPGQPGQTVVAVGTGGIGVARIKGTPDKHLFRSYIFHRK